MQRLSVSIGIIFVVGSLIAFMSWGIFKFQGDRPALPGKSTQIQQPLPVTEAQMTKKTTSELCSVLVAFQADGQTHYSETLPLITVSKDAVSGAVLGTHVDEPLAAQLVEKIPDFGNAGTPTPASVDPGKKGASQRIRRGQATTRLDRQEMKKQLVSALFGLKQNGNITLPLVLKPDEGEVGFDATREKLGFTVLLASFATLHIDHISDEGRNTNLRIAAENIDGVILQPGEEFSYNKVVKERSRKNGFQMAGVISNGKVIPGLGGGICQVSTTLYRIALQSNLKILERYNHSIYDGIQYADRGLDAAVVWGAKDFRFKNTLDTPILLTTSAGPGRVFAAIYAHRKPYDKVELVTRNERKLPLEVKTILNRKLKAGENRIVQSGVVGYTIESYRIVTNNGISREERLSRDTYQAFPKIVETSN